MTPRPAGVTKRDLLVGVLAASAVTVGIHPALDIAAKACEPLFEDYLPDMRRWYPIITPTHARAAIAYAGRGYRLGALTQEEYDWVCTKARMAIIHGKPQSDSALADFPGRLGAARHHEDDDGPPEAA
jgi:hypothetical protein